MDEEINVKNEEKAKPKKNGADSVIFVQTAVCAFIIFLAVLTGKLSPQLFETVKKEYNELMSVDMSAQEIVQSVASAAQEVISVEASAAEPEESECDESEAESEKTVAVMATVGDTEDITVPVHGRITSEYGYRTNPISGAYALHSGVDIATDEGTPISAAYSGVVKDTGVGVKRGKYVLMEHSDGSQTLYCHCSQILVDEDDMIMAGEQIALVGSTGWSTGPHLHFEIRRDGSSIDPLTVLSAENGRI